LFADLINAPVLFFLLGVVACLVRSDLDIPQPIPKMLSLYLLVAIGLKGGVGIREAEASVEVIGGLVAAVALSAAVPVWTFFLMRRRLGAANAAGVAATYGSISAVTFIIAAQFLTTRGVDYGGHMVAAMALMESPAIVVGILLASRFGGGGGGPPTPEGVGFGTVRWGRLLHEAIFNSAVLLLLGSLLIGVLIGPAGLAELSPLVVGPFKGVLCLFLLDMGLVATRRLDDLRRAGWAPMVFGIVAAPVHAAMGLAVAWAIGLSPGNALLLGVLSGSASYIAVPAALRMSLPAANPSIYVPMSLGLTFPFNVVIGIPLYWAMIRWAWGLG
jgi:hypothetical protein